MHLGTHLHHQGVTADDLRGMSTDEVNKHARAAGMGRAPSSTVVSHAIDYMGKLAAPKPADYDPFAGL